jgi:hypothetical protein
MSRCERSSRAHLARLFPYLSFEIVIFVALER